MTGSWVGTTTHSTIDTDATTAVECLPLLRGVGHTRPCGTWAGACETTSVGFPRIPGGRALTRGPSLCRVGSTVTGHPGTSEAETNPPAAERRRPGPSASAAQSGPRRSPELQA